MSDSKNIAVVGAGLMGHGIALTFARVGHQVTVSDPSAEALDSLRSRVVASLVGLGESESSAQEISTRVHSTSQLADSVAEAAYVFEAGPEKLALKRTIFAEIEEHAPADCVLASNTSVIQITKIMQELKGKHRALGTHWWNPPHMIPLVEVVKTEWTDNSVAQSIFDLLENAGKTPVKVEKDVPGFIGNRLQHALWREAISLVENGVCDAAAVDTVIKASFGRRLAVLGPLENADLVGTDLTQDIHSNVLFDLESSPDPSPYLQQLIDKGQLGMKSGQGFYSWTDEQAETVRARVSSHLKKLEGILD